MGRPKLPTNEKKGAPVQALFSADELTAIDKFCGGRFTRSKMVREAVLKHINYKPKPAAK